MVQYHTVPPQEPPGCGWRPRLLLPSLQPRLRLPGQRGHVAPPRGRAQRARGGGEAVRGAGEGGEGGAGAGLALAPLPP